MKDNSTYYWLTFFYFTGGVLIFLLVSLLLNILDVFSITVNEYIPHAIGALGISSYFLIENQNKSTEMEVRIMATATPLIGYATGYLLIMTIGIPTWPITTLLTVVFTGIFLWLHNYRTV